MSIYLYLELNSFSIAILLLLLFNLKHCASQMPDDLLFRAILILTIAVLSADTGGWLLERQTFRGARALLISFDTAYFFLTGIICFFWLLYADYKIREDLAGLRRRLPVYSIPALIFAVLALLTPATGWFFSIGPGNLYLRGPLYWVQAALGWLYPAYSTGIAAVRLRHEVNQLKRVECGSIIVFMALPMLGSILQTLFYGLPLVWTFGVVSLLMIFLNIQNEQISTDALTGINNRGRLNKFLMSKLSSAIPDGQHLYLLLMDVNHFKNINDRYGHTVGDAVLIQIAKLLKAVLVRHGKRDFLARYGGDEFAIVCQRPTAQEAEYYMQEIRCAVRESFPKGNISFAVTLSIGCAEYDSGSMHTMDALISAADNDMYREKAVFNRRTSFRNPKV